MFDLEKAKALRLGALLLLTKERHSRDSAASRYLRVIGVQRSPEGENPRDAILNLQADNHTYRGRWPVGVPLGPMHRPVVYRIYYEYTGRQGDETPWMFPDAASIVLIVEETDNGLPHTAWFWEGVNVPDGSPWHLLEVWDLAADRRLELIDIAEILGEVW